MDNRPKFYRPCPLCGNRDLETLTQLTLPQPSGSPLPEGYRLLACETCDFAFADTPSPQSDYDQYYRELAKYGGPTGTGAGLEPADLMRLGTLATRLTPWLPTLDATILDLGCGAGGLLSALGTLGYTQAKGLDPDPAAVLAARQKGLEVETGLASQAAALYAGQKFDLIVLSHVVEHLRDLDWLADLSNLLSPGGALYIEVPNPKGYRCGPRPPFYYFDSEHINHFGRRALTHLFTSADLAANTFLDCTLKLADGSDYPAIAGIGIAGASLIRTPATNSPPQEIIDCLRTYVVDSTRQAAERTAIHPPLDPAEPLLVWGAGSWAQRLLGENVIPAERLEAFLDSAPNKQGQRFGGVPILSPAEGLARYSNARILVCITVNPRQIEAEIARLAPEYPHSLHFITEQS